MPTEAIPPVSQNHLPPHSEWPSFMTAAAHQAYHAAEDGISAAAAEGYSHWYIDGSLEGERPSDWTEERITSIKRRIQETGVSPVFHGNFKVPLGSDVLELALSARHYIEQEINICASLGGAPLIVHGGGIVEPRLVMDAKKHGIEHLTSSLNMLIDYAKSRGVEIWFENLCNYNRFHPFYYVGTTQSEIEAIIEQVPRLKLFLDVSHAFVNGGNPVEFFEKHHHRIAGMSFSDNEGDRDTHLPLGRGKLDYAALLTSVTKHKWQGLIGFETRGGVLEKSVEFLHALTPESVE